MTYLELAYLHLVIVLPAFLIGTYLLFTRKGTAIHKMLGKVYMSLMLFTTFVTLFMQAQVGPTAFNHFGLIHILSAVVLYFVPASYFAVKKGNIRKHKASMIGVYVGGPLVAGAFALMPGRLLHGWLFV